MGKLNGRQIAQMAKDTFGTERITQEQLSYILDLQKPSTYLLRNHTISNQPMTFKVPNRNKEKARSHRPWQVDIVNSDSDDLVVQKARQLG